MNKKRIPILLLLGMMIQNYNVYALDNTVSVVDQKKESILEVEVKQASNFIQPEGITNICSEINFKKKCKEASYRIDMSHLMNEINNGTKVMNYELDKVIVQIIDLNDLMILTKNIDYIINSVIDNEIVIRFTSPIIEEGSNYKIAIYVPTTIGHHVVYGGKDINTYLNKYVKGHQKGTVKAIVEAFPKVGEVVDEEHQVTEVYSSTIFSKETSISLNYIEIARIC